VLAAIGHAKRWLSRIGFRHADPRFQVGVFRPGGATNAALARRSIMTLRPGVTISFD
jgi:hypothetical protein